MGPIPPESTLKDGIVAVAKRVRDPLEKEKSPSLKRPHILTPSSIENSMTTSQTSNSFSLPQNLAPIIPSENNKINDQDSMVVTDVDHHTQVDEIEPTSHPFVKNSNLKVIKPENKKESQESTSKTKKVTFEEDEVITIGKSSKATPPSPFLNKMERFFY